MHCSLIFFIHLTNVYLVPANVLGSVWVQAPAHHTHTYTHTYFSLENQGMQLHRNYYSAKNSPRRNKKEALFRPVLYRQLSQPGIRGLPEVFLLGLGVKGAPMSDLCMWLKGQALHTPSVVRLPAWPGGQCHRTAGMFYWQPRSWELPGSSASSSAAV